MRNGRTMGQRGARVLIWLCVLVAESLYAASVLKLAGTPSENWIIVTLSLALVCVGMLMGFKFAGAFGGGRPPRQRGWESKGKPDNQPVRQAPPTDRERARQRERADLITEIVERRSKGLGKLFN